MTTEELIAAAKAAGVEATVTQRPKGEGEVSCCPACGGGSARPTCRRRRRLGRGWSRRVTDHKLRELPGYDLDDPSFASPQPPRRAPDPIQRLVVLPTRSELAVPNPFQKREHASPETRAARPNA